MQGKPFSDGYRYPSGGSGICKLIAIRDAVRAGVRLNTKEFHDVHHSFAESLWNLRVTVRADLGLSRFRPEDLDQVSWSERETCDLCSAQDLSDK